MGLFAARRSAAALLASVLLLAASPFAQARTEFCALTVHPIWREAEGLVAQLERDPFSAGLEAFAQALKKLRTDLDAWLAGARKQCAPYEPQHAEYEAAAGRHNERCGGQPPQAWAARGCQASFDELNATKARLDAAHAAIFKGLNPSGRDLLARVSAAVEKAKAMLDPANTEEALWLFASRKSREVRAGGLSSCEAMAQIYGALGARVGWELQPIVFNAGRVLAGEVRYRAITIIPRAPRRALPFSASGFRAQYVDRAADNQVRHFAGYLAMGAKVPGPVLTEVFTSLREEGEPGDYELGVFAGNLAEKLAQNSGLARGLEGAIRSSLCR